MDCRMARAIHADRWTICWMWTRHTENIFRFVSISIVSFCLVGVYWRRAEERGGEKVRSWLHLADASAPNTAFMVGILLLVVQLSWLASERTHRRIPVWLGFVSVRNFPAAWFAVEMTFWKFDVCKCGAIDMDKFMRLRWVNDRPRSDRSPGANLKLNCIQFLSIDKSFAKLANNELRNVFARRSHSKLIFLENPRKYRNVELLQSLSKFIVVSGPIRSRNYCWINAYVTNKLPDRIEKRGLWSW